MNPITSLDMALPKTLIRLFKPYVLLLTGGMLYLAATQLSQAENSAESQSSSKHPHCHLLSKSNIEATFGKIVFLRN
ncbi:hypothetical protein O9929_12535 [Vibrio lentus]|nr:hypothetical protein [Vibrio lentus]